MSLKVKVKQLILDKKSIQNFAKDTSKKLSEALKNAGTIVKIQLKSTTDTYKDIKTQIQEHFKIDTNKPSIRVKIVELNQLSTDIQNELNKKVFTLKIKSKITGKDFLGEIEGQTKKAKSELVKMNEVFDGMRKNITKLGLVVLQFYAVQFLVNQLEVMQNALQQSVGLLKEFNTIAQLGDDRLQRYYQSMVRYSSTYGTSLEDLLKAGYEYVSATFDPQKTEQFIESASKLSMLTHTTMQETTNIVTTILKSYDETVNKAEVVTDQLVATVYRGKLKLEELNTIGQALSLAQTAGVSVEEVLASISALTKTGIQAREAVTYVRGLLKSLIKPTEKAAEASKQLGIEWNLSALRAKGLSGILAEIQQKATGQEDVLANMIGRVEGLTAALNLTGTKHAEFLKDLEYISNSESLVSEGIETIQGSYIELKNTINAIKNSIVALIGTFIRLLDVTGILKGLKELFIFLGKEPALGITTLGISMITLIPSIKAFGSAFHDVGSQVFTAIRTMSQKTMIQFNKMTMSLLKLESVGTMTASNLQASFDKLSIKNAFAGIGTSLTKLGVSLLQIGLQLAIITVTMTAISKIRTWLNTIKHNAELRKQVVILDDIKKKFEGISSKTAYEQNYEKVYTAIKLNNKLVRELSNLEFKKSVELINEDSYKEQVKFLEKLIEKNKKLAMSSESTIVEIENLNDRFNAFYKNQNSQTLDTSELESYALLFSRTAKIVKDSENLFGDALSSINIYGFDKNRNQQMLSYIANLKKGDKITKDFTNTLNAYNIIFKKAGELTEEFKDKTKNLTDEQKQNIFERDYKSEFKDLDLIINSYKTLEIVLGKTNKSYLKMQEIFNQINEKGLEEFVNTADENDLKNMIFTLHELEETLANANEYKIFDEDSDFNVSALQMLFRDLGNVILNTGRIFSVEFYERLSVDFDSLVITADRFKKVMENISEDMVNQNLKLSESIAKINNKIKNTNEKNFDRLRELHEERIQLLRTEIDSYATLKNRLADFIQQANEYKTKKDKEGIFFNEEKAVNALFKNLQELKNDAGEEGLPEIIRNIKTIADLKNVITSEEFQKEYKTILKDYDEFINAYLSLTKKHNEYIAKQENKPFANLVNDVEDLEKSAEINLKLFPILDEQALSDFKINLSTALKNKDVSKALDFTIKITGLNDSDETKVKNFISSFRNLKNELYETKEEIDANVGYLEDLNKQLKNVDEGTEQWNKINETITSTKARTKTLTEAFFKLLATIRKITPLYNDLTDNDPFTGTTSQKINAITNAYNKMNSELSNINETRKKEELTLEKIKEKYGESYNYMNETLEAYKTEKTALEEKEKAYLKIQKKFQEFVNAVGTQKISTENIDNYIDKIDEILAYLKEQGDKIPEAFRNIDRAELIKLIEKGELDKVFEDLEKDMKKNMDTFSQELEKYALDMAGIIKAPFMVVLDDIFKNNSKTTTQIISNAKTIFGKKDLEQKEEIISSIEDYIDEKEKLQNDINKIKEAISQAETKGGKDSAQAVKNLYEQLKKLNEQMQILKDKTNLSETELLELLNALRKIKEEANNKFLINLYSEFAEFANFLKNGNNFQINIDTTKAHASIKGMYNALEDYIQINDKLNDMNKVPAKDRTPTYTEEVTKLEKMKQAYAQLIPTMSIFKNKGEDVDKILQNLTASDYFTFEAQIASTETLVGAFDSLSQGIAQSLVAGEDFGDTMKNIFQNILSQLSAIVIKMLAMKAIFGTMKASEIFAGGGIFGSIFGSLFQSSAPIIPQPSGIIIPSRRQQQELQSKTEIIKVSGDVYLDSEKVGKSVFPEIRRYERNTL